MVDAPATVDAYLDALPPLRRERTEAIRALAHAAFPDVTERIEWQMPVFGRGERWIAVASRAQYLSVYLRSTDWADRIAASDKRIGQGKGCVNIRDTAVWPADLLREAIADRLG